MILKYAVCILAFCLAVSADTENSLSICERVISDKCMHHKLTRFSRSIEHPIKDLIENIKHKIVENYNKDIISQTDKNIVEILKHAPKIQPKNTTIQCSNKDLVLNIVKASISNSDKAKCIDPNSHLATKVDDCTDRIMTTILASRMCNGKNKCTFSVEKDFETLCECSPQKYLELTYTCVEPSKTEEEIKSISKRYIRMNYNRLEDRPANSYSNSNSQPSNSYSNSNSQPSNSYSNSNSQPANSYSNSNPRPAPSYMQYVKSKYEGNSAPKDNYSRMVGASRRRRRPVRRDGESDSSDPVVGSSKERSGNNADESDPVVGSSYRRSGNYGSSNYASGRYGSGSGRYGSGSGRYGSGSGSGRYGNDHYGRRRPRYDYPVYDPLYDYYYDYYGYPAYDYYGGYDYYY